MLFRSTRPLLLALTLLLCPAPQAQETRPASRPAGPAGGSDFIRFIELGPDEGKLETAVTTYAGPKGERVTLVAALHIADEAHYQELNQLFRGYDALLYELVGPKGYRPTPNRKGGGAITWLQRALKQGLDLSYQLDSVDYSPENFVHADLDPETFSRLQKEKGESILTLLFSSMTAQAKRLKRTTDEKDAKEESGAAPEPKEKDPDLASAFRNRIGRHTLRLALGREFEQIEEMASGTGKNGTVLVEGRNDRALEVLQEQIENGKKNLAIYYGGAHMPHMEQRLVRDLGFKKVDQRWLTAWDLHKRLDPEKKK